MQLQSPRRKERLTSPCSHRSDKRMKAAPSVEFLHQLPAFLLQSIKYVFAILFMLPFFAFFHLFSGPLSVHNKDFEKAVYLAIASEISSSQGPRILPARYTCPLSILLELEISCWSLICGPNPLSVYFPFISFSPLGVG